MGITHSNSTSVGIRMIYKVIEYVDLIWLSLYLSIPYSLLQSLVKSGVKVVEFSSILVPPCFLFIMHSIV